MVKIFFTGATGYIGGQVLDALYKANPSNILVTALIRSRESANKLKETYPSLEFIIGGLDDSEVIEKAAANADIVINTADADHLGAIKAITRGLERGGSSASSKPHFFIHTSGVALLFDTPPAGVASPKIWDDVADIEEITNAPDTAMHAVADKLVLSASSPTVKTAIISPGGVYGVGISPFHRNTLIVPWFVDGARKTGDVFVTNQGANIFTFVHVSDLADLYVLLAGRAIAELETGTDSPQGTWGPKAYYFGAAEESSAAEAAKVRATVLKQLGVVKTDEVKSRTVQEATDLVGPLLTIVGSTNARATSTRAKTLLGWNPKGKLTFEGTKKEYEKYLELEKARKGTA